jgi:hypothetical protein
MSPIRKFYLTHWKDNKFKEIDESIVEVINRNNRREIRVKVLLGEKL